VRTTWMAFVAVGLWAYLSGCTQQPPVDNSGPAAAAASGMESHREATTGAAGSQTAPGVSESTPQRPETQAADAHQAEAPSAAAQRPPLPPLIVPAEQPPSEPPPRGDLRTRTFGSDWPRFLGPTNDGKSPECGLQTPWPKHGPRVVWQRRLGIGYAGPTVARGRLYEFSRFDIPGQLSGRARLTCLRSETGEELWRFEYPTDYQDMYGYNNGPRASPVIDDDRVYIFGVEGMLHCLHAETGRLLWSVDTQARFGVVQNFFGVGSTPVVEGDLLLVQVGGSPPESQRVPRGQLDLVRPNASAVVAFDKHTGEVRYAVGDELASYASPVVATIRDRRYGLLFARGGLLAFEPSSGQIDFHFPWRARILESVNASNPVVVGDQVFISECYGPGSALLRVTAQGYEVVWTDEDKRRDKSMQTHWNTPIHVDGYLYGSSGRHSHEAELRCIELATGKVCWSQPELDRCTLLYVDGHLVCLSEYGLLLLLKANPQKFDLVASTYLAEDPPDRNAPDGEPRPLLEYPAWAPPVLAHGLLYVRGNDRLVCLEVIPAP
jgi:outer membrane protein assembly factor BamB